MVRSRTWLALMLLAALAGAADSVDDLVAKLGDADAAVRADAAKALGKLGSKASDALPALTRALEDADAQVRRNAAWALERIRGKTKQKSAKSLAEEAAELVSRNEALWKKYVLDFDNLSDDELAQLVRDYDKAIELYSEALEIEDSPAYNGRLLLLAKRLRKAIFSKGKRDDAKRNRNRPKPPPRDPGKKPPGRTPEKEPEKAPEPEPEVDPLPDLLQRLKGGDGDARRAAAEELGKLGKRAVAPLSEMLDADDPKLQPAVALALYRTGHGGRASLYALMELLGEEIKDREVRVEAVRTIGLIGPPAAAAVPGLMVAIKDKDEGVRLEAVRSLGRIGPAAKKSARLLGDALRDDNPQIRHVAAEALGGVGPAAGNGVWGLVRAIKSEDDKELQKLAVEALGRIGPETAVVLSTLTELLTSYNADLRRAALVALGRIGEEASKATPELLNVLVIEQVEELREMAATSIAKFGEAAVPAVVRALKDKRRDLRWYACKALGRMGPAAGRRGAGALRGALGDDDEFVRIAAAEALGLIGPEAKSAVSALAKTLAKDSRWKVRQAAAVALGLMGEAARSAARALGKTLLEDEDSAVRIAAAEALAKMGPAAKSAASALKTASTEDKNHDVRAAARKSLDAVQG